jgi:Ca2+-binding RTX toxin-like protein
MPRAIISLVLAVSGATLPVLVASPGPAAVGTTATCVGHAVTIDLNDPAAPDPHRDASDVVLGTPGDDDIRTGGGDDVVCAGDGADTLFLGAGADRGYGGRGVDTFAVSPGDDLMAGGGARDWINYWHAGHGLTLDLRNQSPQDTGSGRDVVRSFANAVGARDFVNVIRGTCGSENLSGGNKDDRIGGLCGRDVLTGGRGDDHLSAGPGADLLRGGYGRDDLAGQGGDDELLGATGNDLLQGGGGSDRCEGGLGDDVLRGCEIAEQRGR